MKRTLSLFLLLSIASCSRHKPELSFYYWKIAPQETWKDTFETNAINRLDVQHFYIHYMDVDWNASLHMPVPRAWIDAYSDKVKFLNHSFSPVIYITNNTFLKMDTALCDTLAYKLARAIDTTTNELRKAFNSFRSESSWVCYDGIHYHKDTTKITMTAFPEITEVQIDCDWTSKTKDKYFYFLKKFKERFPAKTISATIRLYPYKYPGKMGVPPVDKGMLMCYNLGNITTSENPNSILDPAQLKAYMDAGKYPLPLDVAMPVFGWYAWFRGNRFKGIIYRNNDEHIDSFLLHEKDNIYRAKQDFEVQYQYIRNGDMLRSEFPEEQQLIEAANLLEDKLDNIHRISFYHWDKDLLKIYEPSIQKIYSRF